MIYPWMPLLQPLRKYFNQQRCQWSEHFRDVTPIFIHAQHVFICKYKLYSTILIDGVTHCIHSNLITSQAVYYWKTEGWLKILEFSSSILLKNWRMTEDLGVFKQYTTEKTEGWLKILELPGSIEFSWSIVEMNGHNCWFSMDIVATHHYHC